MHDEVLARLLKRAEEERLQGLEASARGKKGAPGKPRKKPKPSDEPGFLDLEESRSQHGLKRR